MSIGFVYCWNTSGILLYIYRNKIKINVFAIFVLFLEGTAQACIYQFDRAKLIYLARGKMAKTARDIFTYFDSVVSVFGILGNILVVISILNQRCLLKSNHYILVLQLAICDLGVLIIYLLEVIVHHSAEEPHFLNSVVYCIFGNLFYVFRLSGVGVMLVISVLRYRATAYPLRPAIS